MVPPSAGDTRCVVFIVCGGFKVSLSDTEEFRSIVEHARCVPGTNWEVRCDDGEIFKAKRDINEE